MKRRATSNSTHHGFSPLRGGCAGVVGVIRGHAQNIHNAHGGTRVRYVFRVDQDGDVARYETVKPSAVRFNFFWVTIISMVILNSWIGSVGILVAAVCFSLISKIMNGFKRTMTVSESGSSVFVGIVSFCDSQWPLQVQQLMESATSPQRLRFGVVEYVERAEDTQEASIPSKWRSFVRIYTVSECIASSQREARMLCYEQMYSEEHFVMFSRSIDAVKGWDDMLVDACDGTTVISTRLSTASVAIFPAVRLRREGEVRIVIRH